MEYERIALADRKECWHCGWIWTTEQERNKKKSGNSRLGGEMGWVCLYFSYTFLVLTTKSTAAPSSSSSRNIVCNQAMGLNFLATCRTLMIKLFEIRNKLEENENYFSLALFVLFCVDTSRSFSSSLLFAGCKMCCACFGLWNQREKIEKREKTETTLFWAFQTLVSFRNLQTRVVLAPWKSSFSQNNKAIEGTHIVNVDEDKAWYSQSCVTVEEFI